ncbi:mercuric transporter MerT family protein [Sediminimonas sp.]|uniref:mercuric transporter MerT family protein n=1 Tax=Sediminimonas sp. TaxID=2823379 RepID=UPI0025CBEB78|nr:mercuric transporter MerT family protein [Sediminimonas sp.]
MSATDKQSETSSEDRHDRKGWLAVGGVMGAFLASACCVGPLVLLMLGISGAWISTLTALEPYKPVFAVIALGFIVAGFWQVHFRRPAICAADSYCARPSSARITKAALWAALMLVLSAITIDWWAPFLY